MTQRYVLGSLSVAVLSCAVLVAPLSAVSDRASEARAGADARKEERKEQVAAKLDENKRRVCEKRLATITRTMSKMQLRGEKQLEVFNKIAERTQTFYEEKQRTIDNYDDLVAAVEEKKQAAQLSVVATADAIQDFSCEADDPTAIKDLFKAQLADQIAALKAYKTAVKDLIVGVKSAQGQASRSSEDTSQPTESTDDATQTETQGEQQ